MKVLLTLQDVEPAVRLNALLEQEGVETAVVSPLDDIRGAHQAREAGRHRVHRRAARIRRPSRSSRSSCGTAPRSSGSSDNVDPAHVERLRALGYVDVFAKPVNLDEVRRRPASHSRASPAAAASRG